MNDWADIDRHMGPAGSAPEQPTDAEAAPPPHFSVPTPVQAEGAPSASPIIEPLRPPEPVTLPAVAPAPEPESDEWTPEDEFNPRYCPSCHKRIPQIVSERQEMCNACLAARGVLTQPLPSAGAPYIDLGPPVVYCPACASQTVEREWKSDWVSTAVDIVSDAAALGTMLLGSIQRGTARGLDWNHDVGRVKVMRHRCLACGHIWVE